jgi:hypothetical protein
MFQKVGETSALLFCNLMYLAPILAVLSPFCSAPFNFVLPCWVSGGWVVCKM